MSDKYPFTSSLTFISNPSDIIYIFSPRNIGIFSYVEHYYWVNYWFALGEFMQLRKNYSSLLSLYLSLIFLLFFFFTSIITKNLLFYLEGVSRYFEKKSLQNTNRNNQTVFFFPFLEVLPAFLPPHMRSSSSTIKKYSLFSIYARLR